jgi:peptidoglycan hydrolase-like protein with peptidoglycan-binding domain
MASPSVSKKVKKKVSRGGGPSQAQRDWIAKLGDFGGAGGGNVAEEEGGGEEQSGPQTLSPAQQVALEGAVKEGFIPAIPGIPGGEIPGKVIDVIAGERAAVVRIANNTGQPLRLDPLSLREVKKIGKNQKIGISDGAEYDVLPPDPLGPGQPAEILVTAQDTGGLSFRGAEARLRYFIDDQKTAWIIHFDNSPFSKAKGSALLDGPNKTKFKAPKPVINDGKKSVFAFSLNGEGGPVPPGEKPGKGGGETDIGSSCMITVNNQTSHQLTLVDQDHEIGDFMTMPPAILVAGASCQFVSVETPRAEEEGCKGSVKWEVGAPGVGMCTMMWDNPEGKKNTTDTKIEPSNIGLRVLDQIGQGEENVPVTFTISGGPDGPTPPGPGPVPPGPEPAEDFVPPPESKQPTLRKGDKSDDGWVEYLCMLLDVKAGSKLPRDGKFSAAVHKVVVKYQGDNGLMVDGIVGNQTWASLRDDAPEKPSTDGREPGTFVEEGAEARWDFESNLHAIYRKKDDEVLLAISSVGQEKIDNFEAKVRVTPPNGKPKIVKIKIGKSEGKRPKGGGALHTVKLKKFKKAFPAPDPNAQASDYFIESFMPPELGGDFWSGNVQEF